VVSPNSGELVSTMILVAGASILIVQPAGASLPPTVAAVVNAASVQSGAVSPGEVVAIFGSGLGPSTPATLALDQTGKVSISLAGVQVVFAGTPAPLIYASATQINCVVPYEILGIPNPYIQVIYQGQTSGLLQLTAASTGPALFTANGSGTGPGAIVNQDNSSNSVTPAPKGSTVSLYMTGEGQTSPSGVTGKITTVSSTPPITPQPLLPVAVLINGQPATVTWYGEAPGLVSGVMQLDVQIPANAPSGNLRLQVSVGGIYSQNGVTVSVQ
jgi:uncharacterized protein (TIGR03437 family)